MNIKTVGSVCSGIEAASVAWKPLGFSFEWLSEIADFPSKILACKYPNVPNLGDMNKIPEQIRKEKISAPDMICGGTPCQAFSFSGWQNGLNDERGNLTLKFVNIIQMNDVVRSKQHKSPTIVFWENVEGILSDSTNAFGCFISSLAGFDSVLTMSKWPCAGIAHGSKRNLAWRVLDAKYFGVPQQRRRLYLLAGGTDFYPENVLFEEHLKDFVDYPSVPLIFQKDGHNFELFREYTDCLYAAYGTKWNGNAAAYNGSLFVVQNGRLRRLSPLESERLMGFPDNYTDINGATRTKRYQALGNSWVVPVVRWIGERILNNTNNCKFNLQSTTFVLRNISNEKIFIDCGKGLINLFDGRILNCTSHPEKSIFADIRDIVSTNAPKEIYISPVGCYGIIRRKHERKVKINPRLENILLNISSQMSAEAIEKKSRIQKRGKFSAEGFVLMQQ